MRDKKSGAWSKVQKLKRRISQSFGKLSLSKSEDNHSLSGSSNNSRLGNAVKSAFRIKGFSDEYLERIECNGNTSYDQYSWDHIRSHEALSRQLSICSDSKLLEEGIRDGPKVVLRSKPPRPKSEAFLCNNQSKSKRYSAFGGDSPFGQTEAYVKLDHLGEGSYASVYKGYSNLTQQVVALKEIVLMEQEGTPFTAIREASLLKQLKHANIVTLHDIVLTKTSLTFVFEYVYTDLFQFLEMYGQSGLKSRNVKLILFQLVRGLEFCHKRTILHRDIKPQNLLVSEIGELKIADFGLARAKSVPSHTYSHEVVTLWYRPPDVLLGSTDYSVSLDMWGVGCIFIEMVTGSAAFTGVNNVHDQLDKIFRVLGTPTEETWPGVSQLPHYSSSITRYKVKRLAVSFPRLRDVPFTESLAASFLQLRPTKRISAKEALRHEYFADLSPFLFDLQPEESVFTIPGVDFVPEAKNPDYHLILARRKEARELRNRYKQVVS